MNNSVEFNVSPVSFPGISGINENARLIMSSIGDLMNSYTRIPKPSLSTYIKNTEEGLIDQFKLFISRIDIYTIILNLEYYPIHQIKDDYLVISKAYSLLMESSSNDNELKIFLHKMCFGSEEIITVPGQIRLTGEYSNIILGGTQKRFIKIVEEIKKSELINEAILVHLGIGYVGI